MELFNGAGVDRKRYTQLSFKEYCLGPDKVGVCVPTYGYTDRHPSIHPSSIPPPWSLALTLIHPLPQTFGRW